MMIAIINNSAISGLRCSFSRLVAINSPKTSGNNTTIKMNARSENKGRTFMETTPPAQAAN
jgi:hypothetical protein